MLLTKSSEYALLSLLCIKNSQTAKNAKTLSITLKISRSFLAKILQRLTHAGILVSFKGRKGGFVLAKDSSEITILEIIKAVEDTEFLIFYCSSNSEKCIHNKIVHCFLGSVFCKLQVKTEDFLSNVYLDDLT